MFSLYFAYGRWYNPDTALWLSPDEKGDYFYGGAGQDAINKALVVQPKAHCAQQEPIPTDCERFVLEVQGIISTARAAGESDSSIVTRLAEYYSGIPTTWNILGLSMPALYGAYDPVPRRSFASQRLPFEGFQDRWVGPKHIHDLNSQGEEERSRYGFKRIFFTNTHHYFAEFYLNWFWGGIADTESWSRNREIGQYRDPVSPQPYGETEADIALSAVARDHVKQIKALSQRRAIIGEHTAIPGRAIQILPDLLAQDACGHSDSEIYAGWPPPDIERILGPDPNK